jgi:thiamine-phosphate pyrophosphorylase
VRPVVDLDLYLIADPTLCGPRGLAPTVAAALAGGVTAVQLRAPGATTRELCRLGSHLQEILVDAGVPLIVNDRLDVAQAVGATGVHLGQRDLDVRTARRLGGPDLVIGLSVSTAAELAEANELPPGVVDHLGLGPVFATATKPEAAAALGLDATAALCAATRLPCVAIGGIGPDNVTRVRATGVAGVAVVSAICAAEDPQAAAERLCSPRALRQSLS